ncbi:MAG TPA: hypothetical protein VF707_03855 [Ardenticatenaceae bacterium]|jgi:hypothetical protein
MKLWMTCLLRAVERRRTRARTLLLTGALMTILLPLVGCSNFNPLGRTSAPRVSNWLVAVSDWDEEPVLHVVNPLTRETVSLSESDGSDDGSQGRIMTTESSDNSPVIGSPSRYGLYSYTGYEGVAGYPLPDNRRVVYLTRYEELWELVVSDTNRENRTVLVQDAAYIFPVVDPADGIIAATATDEDGRVSGYTYSLADGSQLATLFQEVDSGQIFPLINSDKIFYDVTIDEEYVSFIGNADGSESVEIDRVDEEDSYDLRWQSFVVTPDGERILYTDADGLWSRPLGEGEREEIRRGSVEIIDLSTRGDYLLVREQNDDSTADLFLIGVADNSATDLVRAAPYAWAAFTQNGQQVLVYNQTENSDADLALYSIADEANNRLLRGEQISTGRVLATDGRYYAVTHAREVNGNQELSVIDSESGELVTISDRRDNRTTAFDIQNSQVLFAAYDEFGATGLYLHNIDGDEEEPILLDDQADDYYQAQLVDDGRRVVFNATFGSDAALYVVNSDGRQRELLLDDALWLDEDR